MYYLFKWNDTKNTILVKWERKGMGQIIASKINNGGYWKPEDYYPLNIEPNEVLLYKHRDLEKVKERYLLEII